MRLLICSTVTALFLCQCAVAPAEPAKPPKKKMDRIDIILNETKPLNYPRDDRLPLYIWAAKMVGGEPAALEARLKQLDERGIAAITNWGWRDKDLAKSIEAALVVGRAQKKLGLMVNVDATGSVYRICDGSDETAHVAEDGTKFFDTSFANYVKIGCPFALRHRYEPMRQRQEAFLKAYKEDGVPVDLWCADWEIDGPIEWNDAWANSKKCTRCRENIPDLDDFRKFQIALRRIRSDIQNEVFCKPIKKYFPKALIGNYGMYPHDGYRYWYDYFEKFVEGAPAERVYKAIHRRWAQDFEIAGYTFAMPVVYSWYRIYSEYGFKNKEYRWFYNMLLVASNAGQHTPPHVPLIPFVHWTTTVPPKEFPEGFVALSEEKYKELLWHMLLRGHDTLCMWCPGRELAQEVRPLHEVYAASLEYKEFLDKGLPVLFDVPKKMGAVVSALLLGNRLLVRRTDFGRAPSKVNATVLGRKVRIPKAPGECQILVLQ